MKSVTEIFGSMVFNPSVMEERLPAETYEMMQKAIKNNKRLDLEVANVVANAMKDWAIENGATHYTHWFQPMTGVTAEKHDSFITPTEEAKLKPFPSFASLRKLSHPQPYFLLVQKST